MKDTPAPELSEVISDGPEFALRHARLAGGERVIVKLPVPGADMADLRARMKAELALTQGVSHPGLLSAQAMLETGAGPMLVYPDRGMLPLAPGQALPPEALGALARQIAEALEALHGAGIAHCDIRPANVFVSEELSEAALGGLGFAERVNALARRGRETTAPQGGHDYAAPETGDETGRRRDHRADLYSLGVLLYELATGRQPFRHADAATVRHRHMALQPQAPAEVSATLSEAIMRLLAKDPDERFQSAGCFLAALTGTGPRADPRLDVPIRLFGRSAELARRLEDGKDGASRLIRVTGPSGAGKSTLIAETLRATLGADVLFVQGKFDQIDRVQPYSAFLQACDMLLRRVLSGTADEIEACRARLLQALSPNAQVLLEILPPYLALIGPQPPVPPLGLSEAQIRMSLVFRRFVSAMAQAEAPLVVFLDDLQWADGASLAMLEMFLTDSSIRNLTILTAYRDDEVGPEHPVQEMLDRLGTLEPAVEVTPLSPDQVRDLIAESLGESAEAAAPLARIIARKTAGNPFFIRQFLSAMVHKGLLFHDAKAGCWHWNEDQAMAEGFTDNVADLVAERILALPEETQTLVRLAACIGNSCYAGLLALCAEKTPEDVARLLESALQGDVLAPDAGGDTAGQAEAPRYRFLHDRVQQAAYDMLPAEARGRIHARIGVNLLDDGPGDSARLVEVADHLIAGRAHLDAAMLLRLRDVALKAAARTMAANAYEAALRYLDAAAETLPGDAWESAPELAFRIGLDRARLAYLRNRTELAEEIAGELLARPLDPLDRVLVLELVILVHSLRLNYLRALEIGMQALALVGEKLPRRMLTPRLLFDLARTGLVMSRYAIADLLDLPQMEDERKLAAMRVLDLLAPPAYFSAPNLLPLIALRMVRLSVRHGNAPESARGYSFYGMLQCAVFGRPERGLAYGQLARDAVPKLGAQHLEAGVLMIFAGFIQHWSAPLSATLPVFLEGAEKALSVGDLENHGYTRYGHASYALMAGQTLPRVAETLERHLAAVTDASHQKTMRIMRMARASVARMRGLPPVADGHDEAADFKLWSAEADATSLAYFHKFRMLEALMAGDYAEALARTRGMRENLNGIFSMAYHPYFQFYQALALIVQARTTGLPGRWGMRAKARMLTRRIERLARHAPATFAHRAVLLRAELDASAGRHGAGMRGFDRAVAAARASGALHDVGLFLERTALFYAARGAEAQSRALLGEALAAHGAWGGEGWCEALLARHEGLARPRPGFMPEEFDRDTLIRAAAATTQKTSLDEMVGEVVRAIAQNAGADRVLLLLNEDGTLRPAADLAMDGEDMQDVALGARPVPQGIANYVLNAGEPVLLDDATLDEAFAADLYVASEQPHSVLCVPLTARGKVVGVIYLENAGLRGAFSEARCRMVEVLGAQAAVSLENARLFEQQRGILERQVDLTSAHARFVPHNFLEMLGRKSITDVRLGDHVRGEASILFSDIRGFTPLIESMNPDEAIGFINAFLSRVEPAVRESGGFVDSFIGDAVMAVFDRGPAAAVDAGIAMARALREWRLKEGPKGSQVRIGLGVATGDLIFGTIGAVNRLKCGVFGDTVNLASRLEGLTKHYGVGFLITRETRDALPDPARYMIREIDLVTVVGRKTPVGVFEVFDADGEALRLQKQRTAMAMARGLRLYQAGDPTAARAEFETCCAEAPDDPVAPILLARCERDAGTARTSDWSGVEAMKSK